MTAIAYGKAVIEQNTAEELAREAYQKGDHESKKFFIDAYHAARKKVRELRQLLP